MPDVDGEGAVAAAGEAPAPPSDEAVDEKLQALEREIDQDRVRGLERLSDEVRGRAEGLAREVASLREELKQKSEQLQRFAADFDNARKRQQREVENANHAYKLKLFKGMVPFFDAMARGAKAAEEGDDSRQLQEGMGQLYQHLLKVLAEVGVVPLQAVGKPFDPRFHEAMMTCPSPGAAPGTVVLELQQGWLIEDRVLRPARVGVVPHEEPASGGSGGAPPASAAEGEGGDEDEVLVEGEHDEEVTVGPGADDPPRDENG